MRGMPSPMRMGMRWMRNSSIWPWSKKEAMISTPPIIQICLPGWARRRWASFSTAKKPKRQKLSFPDHGKRRRIEMVSAMKIPDLVLEKLRELPPDKQQAVLEFVESLQQNGAPAKPLKGFEGLLEKYNVQITEADMSEAWREMWGNFLLG